MQLSVIIPGFGRQRVLAEAQAAHIRAMTAEVGLEAEVIVVGGTSVGTARNAGLREATGDWLAWVDADDEVSSTWAAAIRSAIESAGQTHVDDIVFDMVVVRKSGECLHAYGREATVETAVLVADLLRDIRIGNHLFRHLTRRQLWHDIAFDDVRFLEDALALPRVLAKARSIAYVAKPIYRYIVHEDSLCSRNDAFAFFDILRHRADEMGGPAVVGAAISAFNCRYDRTDRRGQARSWLFRHLPTVLLDREVPAKWKLKFVLAACGIVIRRPK